MKKILITMVCLTLFWGETFAQSVTGKVVDGAHHPFAYVSCVLKSLSDSAYVAGAVSSKDGTFKLPVKSSKKYLLELSYMGCKSVSKICKCGNAGTLVLREESKQLDEVVVKAERPLVEVKSDCLSYDAAGIISQKVVSSAHDLLKELPSVWTLDGNTLNLVGAQNTTVMISGKVSHLSADQINDYLKTLTPEEVDKVEVYYAAPARFHVRGAVINIVLKKKNRKSFNAQVYSDWENQHRNSFDVGGVVLASTPKWGCDFRYKYSDARFMLSEETESVHTLIDEVNGNSVHEINSSKVGENKDRTHTLYGGIQYNIDDKSHVEFVYNGILTPTVSSNENNVSNIFADRNSLYSGEQNLHNFALYYNSQRGISGGLEYTNYCTSGTQDVKQLANKTNPSPVDLFSYYRKQKIKKYRAYLDITHKLPRQWNFNYGVSYNRVNNDNEQRYVSLAQSAKDDFQKFSDIREYTASAYVGFQKTFFEGKLSLKGSLVGEIYKINDYKKKTFFPTVNASYKLSKNHLFQLNYYMNRTYPPYWRTQDYESNVDDYSYNCGNPFLRPARWNKLNLTYVLNSKYTFQVAYNVSDDKFICQSYQLPDTLRLIHKTENVDTYSFLSFIASFPVKISNWYSSRMFVDVYREQYKSTDWYGYDYNKIKWTTMLVANNTFTFSQTPRISATLRLVYRLPSLQGLWDLESCWGVSPGLRGSFLKGNLLVDLECNDLFESSYPDVNFRFKEQNQKIRWGNYRRNISLRLTYKFNGFKGKRKKGVDTSRFGI